MKEDIIKSTAFYTLLGFLPLAFAVLFTPIYLTYLGEEDYGVLNLFLLYSGLITQLYGLGVSSIFGFLYWDVYKDKEELNKLVSKTITLLILLSSFFILIGLIVGKPILSILIKDNDSFTFYPFFILMLLYSGIMVFYELFLYYFRNQGNIKKYALLSISTLVLFTIGSVIGVIFLDLKAEGAVYGRTLGYGIVIFGFLIYFIKEFKFTIDFKFFKKVILLSFPIFINSIIGAFGYSMDRILVERIESIEALGLYGFAIVIISVIEIWFNALNNALSPMLYKFLNESTEEKVKEIQGLAHIIIGSVILLIILIISMLNPIFDLLIPENFHVVKSYIPILAAGYIWKVFTHLSCYSLYLEKRTKLLPVDQISYLIMTVLFGYAGHEYMGMMGLVYGVFLVKVAEFIIMFYITRSVRILPLKLNKFIVFSIIFSFSCFITINLSSDSLSDYILFLIPLVISVITVPVLLRSELQNLSYCIKNRKELFSSF